MELSALGSDKRNNQDIFKHCRQFERTFQTMLNEANVAFKIRAVVEGHLPEMLYKIPIEKRFNKNYTREICREADGYQPHLVSPERGIKRLVVEAMKLTEDHVHRFVDEIHVVLLETVKESARNTMTLEVSGGVNSNVNYEYLRLKGFENAVIIAATQALEEWRAEAHKVASMMVQMECDYVTPSFFRELERQWQEENMGQGNEIEDGMETASPQQQQQEVDAMSDDSEAMSPRESQEQQQQQQGAKEQGASRKGWKDGWMEKKAGDSSNLSAPVESWRWQRRWFMLSVESGVLLYSSSPEDMNKKQPKVAMNLQECLVDDLQGEGNSLLIKLQNKNPSLKSSRQVLVLRVSSVEEKHEWVAILRSAALPKQQSPQSQGNGPQRLQRPMPSQRGLMSGSPQDSQDKGLFGRTVDKVSNQFSRLTGLGSSRMGDMTAPGTIQDLDQYYEKLGRFCGIYARMTYDRMAKTVPKAIILCQVIRSRDRLLDQLFQYLSTRTEKEIEFMLLEDPSVGRRRAAASQASKDIADSLEEVRRIVDVRNTQQVRKEEEKVSVRTLLLAGAYPLVPSSAIPKSTDPGRLYGEFTPNALVGGDARQQLASSKKEDKSGDKQAGTDKPTDQPKESMKPRRAAPPPPPGS